MNRHPTTRSQSRARRARWALPLALVFSVLLSPVPSRAAPALVRLPTGTACVPSAQVRPASVVLSCADGNVYVRSITWSTWTDASAAGAGQYTYNTCRPDCAGGTFLSVRVTLRVSTVSRSLFTRLVLTKPDRSSLTLNWSAQHGVGSWVPTTTSFVLAFVPSSHETALRAILTNKSATHSVNKLVLYPSPLDSTWVMYHVGTAVPGGEDNAEGYAHFVAGRWIDVFGPASGFCSEPGAVPGVPSEIRASLAPFC